MTEHVLADSITPTAPGSGGGFLGENRLYRIPRSRVLECSAGERLALSSEFVKKPSRAKGGRIPPERRTVSPGAKRRVSPKGASPKDGTSNRILKYMRIP
ncbi:MAG: hypothetical protein ACREV3_10365, partial [Gammaproteobacteria bacterium]